MNKKIIENKFKTSLLLGIILSNASSYAMDFGDEIGLGLNGFQRFFENKQIDNKENLINKDEEKSLLHVLNIAPKPFNKEEDKKQI